jgi:uncharacterized protein YaaR (DUF327 family)
MASGYQKADFNEQLAIWGVLQTVASSGMVSGVMVCTYQEGWSDEKVFEAVKDKLRPNVNIGSVRGLRLTKLGTVRPPAVKEPKPKPEPDVMKSLWDAIAEMKARVEKTHTIEAVNKWAQTIKDAYDKIEEQMNRANTRQTAIEETQKIIDDKLAQIEGFIDFVRKNPPTPGLYDRIKFKR